MTKITIVRSGQKTFWARPGFPQILIESCVGTKGEKLLDFALSALFNNWAAIVSDAITIKGITLVSIDCKPSGEPIFARMLVEAHDSGGHKLPRVVFLRGGSVAILPILVSEKTGEKYVVFTVQPRLAVGEEKLVEIPAGMLDGSGDFAGVAGKEFKEEIGFAINLSELIPLTPTEANKNCPGFPRGIFISPGACDETMRFYFFQKKMHDEEIKDLKGRLTGTAEEGENIRLMVVPFTGASRATGDGKFFTALALATLQKLV